MTTAGFLVDAVLVTFAKALTVCSFVAGVAIIGRAFWKGRRWDGPWPDDRSVDSIGRPPRD